MSFRKIKITKNIDSILHITNDVIHKNENYRDYIVNQNNSLYMRQLPLLMKNDRMKALISKKLDDSQKNSFSLVLPEEQKESKDKNIFNINKILTPLNNIRNIKIKSSKLPPLCPLYNDQGELIPSEIRSSKVIYKKINYDDFLNRISLGLGFPKPGKPLLKKLEIKKLRYNRSCDNFDLKIKLDDLEKNYFNKPEYEHLKYDEKEIFDINSINTYEEIIKNKIIELQSVHNKNDTIKKEKEYIYGFDKRKILLTLESLKIKFIEIKDEKNNIIEKKSDKPVFEYTLPFALLPLFYFKGIESFLFILTKIIIFKEKNCNFEIEQKSNEIISKILKNCNDFSTNDYIDNNTSEKNKAIIENNDLNNIRNRKISKKTTCKKKSITNDLGLNSEIKTNNLSNQINNTISSHQNNISELNNNATIDPTNTNNINNNTNTNTNNATNNINSDANNNLNDARRSTLLFLEKNITIKTFDIYASRKNNNDKRLISQYEFFWITPIKSFILTIETPLITMYAPSNNNYIRQYINFELLFYIYKNNFIMWDFYIMKYLSTLKNFRLFFEQLYSIPKKMNISFFLTQPKTKKILSTNYEMISIISRPLSERKARRTDNYSEKEIKNNYQLESNRVIRKFESSKTKVFTNIHLNNFKKEINEDNNIIKNNRYSKQFDSLNSSLNKSNKSNKLENTSLSSSESPIKNRTNNNNLKTYNSLFIQKGLLFIASYINEEKGIINEFSIHFNVDQLRKFQIMEVMQDKLTYFLKFMRVDYDKEKIFFDFESFREFDETKWITQINKYNFNYISQHKTISEEQFTDENEDLKIVKNFKGMRPHTKIKVEMKCPLIIMQDLDNNGFKGTERINVDSKVEKIMSGLTIYNSLDLTKQLIEILKDYNYCRKVDNTNRTFKKKTTKRKVSIKENNKLNIKKQTNILSVIADSKEE